MLCANAYGVNDFNSIGLYKNKVYKWGYFLETNKYERAKWKDRNSLGGTIYKMETSRGCNQVSKESKKTKL